jgi:hypothetical protein
MLKPKTSLNEWFFLDQLSLLFIVASLVDSILWQYLTALIDKCN